MRKTLFLLLSFAIIVTTARGVSASTDCQKWLADYKTALAQKTSTQKLLAAKHRAKAYARRKLVQLTTPAPVHPAPTRISSTRPHLTPAQMLKRFDLLCGELPVDAAPQVLDARMSPEEFVSEMAAGGPVDTDLLPTEGILLAENTPPAYDGPSVNVEGSSSAPYYPEFGPIPGGFAPPSGPPSIPPAGAPVPPIAPPVAPVPEPSSVLLLLTGSAGAAAAVRRRVAGL